MGSTINNLLIARPTAQSIFITVHGWKLCLVWGKWKIPGQKITKTPHISIGPQSKVWGCIEQNGSTESSVLLPRVKVSYAQRINKSFFFSPCRQSRLPPTCVWVITISLSSLRRASAAKAGEEKYKEKVIPLTANSIIQTLSYCIEVCVIWQGK